MYLAHEIRIDLDSPRRNVVHLEQTDTVHTLAVNLYVNGVPFNPAQDATGNFAASVRYLKQNGVGGEYSKSPTTSNTPAVTYDSYSNNRVFVKVDKVATDVPGFTELFVKFKDGDEVLHVFPVTLEVGQVEGDDTSPDTPYFDTFIRKDSQPAKTSGMTQSVGIDDNGRLWTTPGASGGGELFVVTLNSQGTPNKSFSELYTAWSAGAVCKLRSSIGVEYELQSMGTTSALFSTTIDAGSSIQVDTYTLSGSTATHYTLSGYVKPSGGVPSTDMSSAVQTSLGKADGSVQKSDQVSASQMSALSIVPVGIDNSGTLQSTAGLVGVLSTSGSTVVSSISATGIYPLLSERPTFPVWLIDLDGRRCELESPPASASDNVVFTTYDATNDAEIIYTISNAGAVTSREVRIASKPTETTLSGSTVTIAEAADNTIYVCGEVSTLTVTARATNAAFTLIFDSPSGSTPTSLTMPSTNVHMPDDFQVEVYTHYEISVDKRGYAVAASWSFD